MKNIRLITDASVDEVTNTKENLIVVPLTISFDKQDYRDDSNLELTSLIKTMQKSKVAGKTSCPSIQDWLNAFEGADKAIVVTMTSAMSGTYESALQARKIYQENNPASKIIVIDSRTAGPELALIIKKIKQLLLDEVRFVDIDKAITKLKTQTHLLFVLQSLHNLALNGRVSPATAKIAELLHMNIIGTANKEGKLEPISKVRGMKKALREIIKNMIVAGYHGGDVIIDYCDNEDNALKLKESVLEKYPQANVQIRPMRGLCSFYAEKGGIMIGFCED